jgi:uncharacterized repeat protein (TIGR02543 family)
MKNFSLKALGAFIFAAGLVVAGVAAPANAATMNVTATASGGTVGTSGTNAYPITLSFAAVTPGSENFQVVLPSGWTFVNFLTICNNTTINSQQTGIVCHDDTSTTVDFDKNPGTYSTGLVSIEFGVGTINVGVNRVFTVNAKTFGTTQDTGTASLAGGVSSSTVTFDANGGTGTTATQTASAATALTSNGFSRSGFTFAGWNTAANGSGTAYADSASFPFSASENLYAQWTATLANTGFDGLPYLATGGMLALAGVTILLFARRRYSN